MTRSSRSKPSHRFSWAISMAAMAVVLAGIAPVPVGGVSTDEWDYSLGSVVTSHTGTLGGDDPRDIFGKESGFDEAYLMFADWRPRGFVHAVEWRTSSARTIRSFNLVAVHDGHGYAPAGECDLPSFYRDAQHRGFDRFKLWAWNATTGVFDILLYDMAIPLGDDNAAGGVHAGEGARLYDPTGALGALKNVLNLSADVPAVTTDRWRAEFTQHGCASNESGPRIYELDGFATSINNAPPTADAGPDLAVQAGDTAALDGTGSFDDNTASENLAYDWSFASIPPGSSAVLAGADTATPSFTADATGTYAVELVVTDEGGLTSPADEVLVSSENLAPTADAGDDWLVLTGTTVTLDGSGSSDPESDYPLAFQWNITTRPPGSTAQVSVPAPGTETANVTPDVDGVYEVELVVEDLFGGRSDPDVVVVTAIDPSSYAAMKLTAAAAVIAGFPDDAFDAPGHRNAMLNHLAHAAMDLSSGNEEHASHDMGLVIERTDGCALRGAPDGNGKWRDWIVACEYQEQVYPLLLDALNAIAP